MSEEDAAAARRRLFAQVDRILSDGAYDNDVRSMARIAIHLGRSLGRRMDPIEITALNVAEAFWSRRASEAERREQLKIIAARYDANVSARTHSSVQGYTNRIAWCALNTV